MNEPDRDSRRSLVRRGASGRKPFARRALRQSIPQRFEEVVRNYGGRPAIDCEETRLSYAELNQLADRTSLAVADRLGPEPEPVAVVTDDAVSYVIAILAALKAGKAYVPLDPAFPAVRTSYMLKDCGARLVLTDPACRGTAEALVEGRVETIEVSRVPAAGGRIDKRRLKVPSRRDAYIIYTSGSTGGPKGVVQTHVNVMHLAMNYANALALSPDDRLTLLQSPGSSATVLNLFSALLTGACLCPRDAKRFPLRGLADWLRRKRITVLCAVPSLWRDFDRTLETGEMFENVRLVGLGGENATAVDAEIHRRHFPRESLFVNGYGMTECGLVSQFFLDTQTPLKGGALPIGYPVPDIGVELVDGRGRGVETGDVGEILIRSRFLSPGYWKRADLTSAVFEEVQGSADERLYNTGDLGRMRADGCLEHLGRGDLQIKVRGHRVEAAEVEAALNAFGLRGAAVVLRGDRSGVKRLVAFIVPESSTVPTATSLRRFLSTRLPEHMIPSAFVALGALPLLPGGKVDYMALPDLCGSRPALESRFVPPRTPFEEKLAAIWRDVLELDEIGVDDDFLDLGGHSLSAGRIVSRVIDEFGVDMQGEALLAQPTVASMALAVAGVLAKRVPSSNIEELLSDIETYGQQESGDDG